MIVAFHQKRGGEAVCQSAGTAVLLTFLAVPAAAQTLKPGEIQSGTPRDQTITYGAETDFNSGYVWRGIALSDKPVIQPSAWISRSGFTFTAWSNFAPANRSESGVVHLPVTDLILTYSRDWKKLRIEPSIEAYLNRRPSDVDDPNTMEGSLKLSYPVGPLRVFTVHAFDVLAYKGAYFGEAGLGWDGRITNNIALAASFRSGWASPKFNDVYIGLDKPAFNFIGSEGSLTYHLKPYLYFRPHFEFSNIADRRLREYLSSPTILNFGLAMGIEF